MIDTDALYDEFMPKLLPIALRAARGDDDLAERIIEATFDDVRRAGPQSSSWIINRHAGYCLSIIRQLELRDIMQRHDVLPRDYAAFVTLVFDGKIVDRGFGERLSGYESCLQDVLAWVTGDNEKRAAA
jgi:hypothetical protein